MSDPGQAPLPERFGKYGVDSLIASGGMAEVYLASTPPPVVRRVAVKRIKPLFVAEQGFLDMFIDEARVSAAFDHPNVIRVIDFESGPPPFLVMEYVDGPDLRRIIWEAAVKRQWVPCDLGAAIIAFAARGLDYAHKWKDPEGKALQVIHRDMSPQNIMLTSGGVVKVVDFGIAKAAGRNTRTQAGIIKGKYAYMAPEQVRGEKLTPRADIFALGILLYEVLTYRNPFRRDKDELTLIAVSDEDPPPPHEHRSDVPEDLSAVCLKALAKDPDARYQTAAELADAIDESILGRRRPVTEAHLADFLAGLDALPMPDQAEPPVSESDREVSEADVAAASQASASALGTSDAGSGGPAADSAATDEDLDPVEADADSAATDSDLDPVEDDASAAPPVDASEARTEYAMPAFSGPEASARPQLEVLDAPRPQLEVLDAPTRLGAAATADAEPPPAPPRSPPAPVAPAAAPTASADPAPAASGGVGAISPASEAAPQAPTTAPSMGAAPRGPPKRGLDWKLPVLIVVGLVVVGALVGVLIGLAGTP